MQILESLRFLRKHNIIHCDLKPENILLRSRSKSGVKLIDFGSSCFCDERIYTYIQSRFYRAPEIMLALPYTPAIDMWSFGCILAELHTGVPLLPGESEPEQMSLIMDLVGLPPPEMLKKATRRQVFFDDDGVPLHGRKANGVLRKTLAAALECEDADFVSLLEGCLTWEPEKRLTPEEALSHRWIIKGLPPAAAPSSTYYATLREEPDVTRGRPAAHKVEIDTELLFEPGRRPPGTTKHTTRERSAENALAQKGAAGLQDKLWQLKQRLKQFATKRPAEQRPFNRTLIRAEPSRNVPGLDETCDPTRGKYSFAS